MARTIAADALGVEFKDAQPDAASSPENIRAPSASRTITLAVEDMHCGGCMRKVETALLGVPGVAAARANLSAAGQP